MKELIKIKDESFNVVITLNTPLALIIRDLFYEGDWEAMEEDLGKNEVMRSEIDTCKKIEESVTQLGEEVYEPVSFPELRAWIDEVGIRASDLNHISLNGLYDLALDYADRGFYDIALDIINFMLDFDPHYAPAYELKGSLLVEQGRVEEGLVYLDKAIDIDPWLVEAYSSLGEGYYNLGEYEKAAYYWEKEIEKAPENKLTYFMLAEAYERLGEHQKAINTLSRLLHRDPDSVLALYEMKEIYERMGEEKKAREVEDRIASIEPKYTNDVEVWAKVMFRRGEYEKAMKVLEAKLGSTRLNTHIKLLLIIPYVKLGLKDKAKEIVEEIKDNNMWYYYGKKELFGEFLSEEEMTECGIS